MFTSSNSGHNRLLALEQELMGWKTSPKQQQDRLEEDEDSISDFEPETEAVEVWDSKTEEEESNSTNLAPFEQDRESHQPEQFSYAALAQMLQSDASDRFKRNLAQLPAKREVLEPSIEEEETILPYLSRQDVVPSAPIRSDRDAVSAFEFSQLPELDLPMSDRSTPSLFDISLPEAEDYTPSPVSSSPFSSGEPSYASLLQVIQSARQSDRIPDELEATIDVESHAIAQEQISSDPLPTPYTSLAASVEPSLLPADRSTDAIASALEPIELEPISDEEEDEDW